MNEFHQANPTRPLRVIVRTHWADVASLNSAWSGLKVPLEISFKYSRAHMYSTPAPAFYASEIKSVPAGQKIWLTVRNDDTYAFRWGDSDYLRTYVKNMPVETMAGFYAGGDGFTLGRDFLTTNVVGPRPLVISKHWYAHTLLGRLGYDPTLPDAYFQRLVGARFPGAPAEQFFTAWTRASQIIPEINRLYFFPDDFPFYSEGCMGRASAGGRFFHSVNDMINPATRAAPGYDQTQGQPIGGNGSAMSGGLSQISKDPASAAKVASALEGHAAAARAGVAGISVSSDPEFSQTLGDITALAALGDYYAAKFRGAVALQQGDRPQAVTHLTTALARWKTYAAAYAAQYQPQMLNRHGVFDPTAMTVWAGYDIALATGANGASPTVAQQAAAGAMTGGSAALTVLGADADNAEPTLTYTWSVVATSPAPVTFSGNGTNAAKATTATFSKPGKYVLEVLIQDPSYNVAASKTLTVAATPESLGSRKPIIDFPIPAGLFHGDSNVWVSAAADAPDGSIAKVEFFDGEKSINVQADEPFTFVKLFTVGTHILTAKATDDKGVTTTSAPVKLVIHAANGNQAPTIVQRAAVPENGQVKPPANIMLSATATDADGTVTRVEFWNSRMLLGTLTAPTSVDTYTFNWVNPPPGDYDIVARASDDQGTVAVAATIAKYHVLPGPTLPVIQTQPVNQSVGVGMPATFAVRASGVPAPTYQWQSAAPGSSTFMPPSSQSVSSLPPDRSSRSSRRTRRFPWDAAPTS